MGDRFRNRNSRDHTVCRSRLRLQLRFATSNDRQQSLATINADCLWNFRESFWTFLKLSFCSIILLWFAWFSPKNYRLIWLNQKHTKKDHRFKHTELSPCHLTEFSFSLFQDPMHTKISANLISKFSSGVCSLPKKNSKFVTSFSRLLSSVYKLNLSIERLRKSFADQRIGFNSKCNWKSNTIFSLQMHLMIRQ